MVKYKYDAYGNYSSSGSTDLDLAENNPIRYRSYYFDEDTGLYYLNARYYNPQWRRFISPDDTAYLDPDTPNGLNLYAYCGNDPVNFVDSCGNFPVPIDHLTTSIDHLIGLYKFILDQSIKRFKSRSIPMDLAKKIARKGGHVQSARAVQRAINTSADDVIKRTKILSENADDFLTKFSIAVFVLDSAWTIGENIYHNNEHWMTDSAFSIARSAIPFALGLLLPGGWGFFVPIAVTAIQCAVDYWLVDKIEAFLDDIGDSWNAFWGIV